MWGGRMPPSGVVAGFRRDVAGNVSERKSRIAPRNVVLTLNAKSRLRPLGGLKPALRPPSGVDTGLAKRELFPSPVYGGRCPQGRRGDEVAKRRKCWARQAAKTLPVKWDCVSRAIHNFVHQIPRKKSHKNFCDPFVMHKDSCLSFLAIFDAQLPLQFGKRIRHCHVGHFFLFLR